MRYSFGFLVFVPTTIAFAACAGSSSNPSDAGGTTSSGDTSGNPSASTGATTTGSSSGGAGGAGGAGTGTGGGGVQTPDTVTCMSNLAPPKSGTCDVTKGAGATVLRGTVIAPDHVYAGGEVVLDATGVITCVGCDCSKTAGYAGATTATCAGAVISPGLINAHEHLTYSYIAPINTNGVRYDYRNEWREGANGKPKISVTPLQTAPVVWFGEMRHVLGGATSVSGDEGSALQPGFLRNLDKAEPVQQGLGDKPVDISVFPLGDTDGKVRTACSGYTPEDTQATIDGDNAYEPHVSEGVSTNSHLEFTCMSGAAGSNLNALKPQTAMIHTVAIDATDAAAMAKGGTAAVWSPRSNISLYGFTAPVTMLSRAGVQLALGTDWTPSGGMSLLRELACAVSYNATYLDSFFTPYQLYRMVTEDAAGAINRESQIGSLAVGKEGDITIWKSGTKDPYTTVITSDVTDVAAVLRAGLVLSGEATIVDALSPDGGVGCEALTDCLSDHKICAMRETGSTVAALQATSTSTYPLFFCGVPDGEPTCLPTRPNEFTGAPSATDTDGDGIPNAMDLCPKVFSAVRPMDLGKQADADGDGLGDVCDPCPLAPNTTDCAMSSSTGAGGSSTTSSSTSSTGAGGAPPAMNVTIAQAKPLADGVLVAIDGPCVTAVASAPTSTTIWIQDSTQTTNAGLVIYSKNVETVAVGDQVSVTGAMSTYQVALREVITPTLTKLGACPVTIAPIVVSPASVATGGPMMAAYISMLLEVDGVSVTTAATTAAADFQVTGALNISSFISPFDATTYPVGTTFTSIRGVLDYFKNASSIDPRSAADIVSP